jgi:hypothetical protein
MLKILQKQDFLFNKYLLKLQHKVILITGVLH